MKDKYRSIAEIALRNLIGNQVQTTYVTDIDRNGRITEEIYTTYKSESIVDQIKSAGAGGLPYLIEADEDMWDRVVEEATREFIEGQIGNCHPSRIWVSMN